MSILCNTCMERALASETETPWTSHVVLPFWLIAFVVHAIAGGFWMSAKRLLGIGNEVAQ